MQAIPIPNRRRLPRASGIPVLLVVCGLALTLGVLAGFAAAPRYELYLNAEQIAVGRDPAQLEQALARHVYREMERPIILVSEGRSWTFRRSELGYVIDLDRLRGSLRESVEAFPWWGRIGGPFMIDLQADGRWEMDRLESAIDPIARELARPAEPAVLQILDRRPVIHPHTEGIRLDSHVLLAALKSLGGQERIDLPLTRLLPEVSSFDLERMGVRRLIAEWSTSYDPSIPRAENVEKAAAALNGKLLRPGEILSYNATVGPISLATGWKQAYVIVGGELVEGVGGGVCQVATTLYGAALRANLEIVERHPHQLAVTYISPSQDAAIAQGWEDLKLRNTTAGHIMIESEAGGGTVTFRIYGDLPEDLDVRIESRVLGSRPFPTKAIYDPSLRPGQFRVKLSGYPGITSEAYRIVSQSGQVIKRELLSRDSYLPTAEVVLTGTPPSPADSAGDGGRS